MLKRDSKYGDFFETDSVHGNTNSMKASRN